MMSFRVFGETSYHLARIIGVTNGNVSERKLESACGPSRTRRSADENRPASLSPEGERVGVRGFASGKFSSADHLKSGRNNKAR